MLYSLLRKQHSTASSTPFAPPGGAAAAAAAMRTNGIAAAPATSAADGANGFGANGFGPNGFGPNGFGPSGFGPSGFGPSGFGGGVAPSEVMCVALSTAPWARNAPLLASGAQDGSVCLWESSSGRLLQRLEAHTPDGSGWVMALVLSRHAAMG